MKTIVITSALVLLVLSYFDWTLNNSITKVNVVNCRNGVVKSFNINGKKFNRDLEEYCDFISSGTEAYLEDQKILMQEMNDWIGNISLNDLFNDVTLEYNLINTEGNNGVTINRTKKMQNVNIPDGNPISGDIYITSSFGERIHPIYHQFKFHTGVDIRCSIQTRVYSTADGVIEFAGYKRGYGNYIVINHGGGYKTAYAHLSTIWVEEGQNISRGHLIGYSGNSGNSTGPHLHYEVIRNYRFVDPVNYMN